MKTVNVFEIYTTKNSHSLFFEKSREWLSQQLVFEVSLFSFILLLHFRSSCVDCYYNIRWSKQPPYIWSSLWDLHFFVVSVFVICGKITLCLFCLFNTLSKNTTGIDTGKDTKIHYENTINNDKKVYFKLPYIGVFFKRNQNETKPNLW